MITVDSVPSNAKTRTKRSSTMRAAIIAEPGVVRIEEIALPEPGPGQLRVRMEGCGVCASNLPPWEGKPWFTYPMNPGSPGHEGWGVVDKVGPGVTRFSKGDYVAMLSGHAYAEYDVTDEGSAVHLPEPICGQPFPGEPLACAINVFRRSNVRSGQTLAIVGIGFLGAILTRLATNVGANVIAISRRPYSLEVAKAMGAAETIPMLDHCQIIDQIKGLTSGTFCDTTIEAIGQQWPLDLSAELTKEQGRLVVAGYHHDGPRQVNMQMWNWKGLDVINAHERDPKVYTDGLKVAVDAVTSGALNPFRLYTHTFTLDHLADALNMTRDRPEGFLKALITMK